MTLLCYAAIYVIWGSTYLAIRYAVDSIPPLLMMGVRCTLAGTLLLLWAARRGEHAEWRAWRTAVVAGALMFGCAYGTLAWAETRLASGTTALLVATVPMWLTIFEAAQRRRLPRARTIIGLAIGLTGVALLVMRGNGGPLAILPVALVLFGEVAWAAGSVYARPPRLPQSVSLNAGMPLLTGGVWLIAGSVASREFHRFDPRAVTPLSIGALVYLTIFGSIVAFSAYAWLMQIAPASRVGTHAYVNPLIAVALGCALASEPFTSAILVSSIVIAGGVALVLT